MPRDLFENIQTPQKSGPRDLFAEIGYDPAKESKDGWKGKIAKTAFELTDTEGIAKAAGLGLAASAATELPSTLAGAAQGISRISLSNAPGKIDLEPETVKLMQESHPIASLPIVIGQKIKGFKQSVYDFGSAVKDWAAEKEEEWFGEAKKDFGGVQKIVYEGGKMAAPSLVPAATVGPVGTAILFAANQYQQTIENAYDQAEKLKSEGKPEEARKVIERAEGPGGMATAGIEGAGEYFGTKWLSRLFGVAEGVIAKRGARAVITDFIKSLGVEIGTESGQAVGQGYVEKYTAIRPEAEPWVEALNTVGPTAVLTAMTGIGGAATQAATGKIESGGQKKQQSAFENEIDRAIAEPLTGKEAPVQLVSEEGDLDWREVGKEIMRQREQRRNKYGGIVTKPVPQEQKPIDRPAELRKANQAAMDEAALEQGAFEFQKEAFNRPDEDLKKMFMNLAREKQKTGLTEHKDKLLRRLDGELLKRGIDMQGERIDAYSPEIAARTKAAKETKLLPGEKRDEYVEAPTVPKNRGFQLVEKGKNKIPLHLQSAVSIMEIDTDESAAAKYEPMLYEDFILQHTGKKDINDVTEEEADSADAAYNDYVFELRKKAAPVFGEEHKVWMDQKETGDQGGRPEPGIEESDTDNIPSPETDVKEEKNAVQKPKADFETLTRSDDVSEGGLAMWESGTKKDTPANGAAAIDGTRSQSDETGTPDRPQKYTGEPIEYDGYTIDKTQDGFIGESDVNDAVTGRSLDDIVNRIDRRAGRSKKEDRFFTIEKTKYGKLSVSLVDANKNILFSEDAKTKADAKYIIEMHINKNRDDFNITPLTETDRAYFPEAKKAVTSIPELKTTGAAIDFGETATQEQIAELERVHAQNEQNRERGSLTPAQLQSNQYYREALEVAKKTPTGLKWLAKRKENVAKKATAKESLPVEKQPWEMTRDEYLQQELDQTGKTANQNIDSRTPVTIRENSNSVHYKKVYRAIKEGKPVPQEVLNDYPDLKENVAKKATVKESFALTKKQKAQKEYTDYISSLTDAQKETVKDLIEENPEAPSGLIFKIKKSLADAARPKPEAVKIDKSPLDYASVKEEGPIYQAAKGEGAPTWYSQMERKLSEKLPGSGTPAQMKQTIQSWAKKGEFKQDELDYSGLIEWLDDASSAEGSPYVAVAGSDSPTNITEGLPAFKQSNGLVKIPLYSGLAEPDPIQGGGTDSELLSNFLDWHSKTKKSFSDLPVPLQWVVLDRVRLALHDPKIGQAIVGSVPVDVMDDLVSGKLSPDTLLNKPSMLVGYLIPNRNGEIPVSVSKALTSIIRTPAFPVTEIVFGTSDVGRWPVDFRTTKRTGNFHGVSPLEFDSILSANKSKSNKKTIRKEDIISFLKNNNVRVEEVEKGEGKNLTLGEAKAILASGGKIYAVPKDDPESTALATLSDGTLLPYIERNPDSVYLREGDINKIHKREAGTKFSQYQMEGEKSGYRELLLTLPDTKQEMEDSKLIEEIESEKERNGESQRYWELVRKQNRAGKASQQYKSSHFEEPNILAHIRFNERTGPNGERVLFIEEVQSDWHQTGRKRVYSDGKTYTIEDFSKTFQRLDDGRIMAYLSVGDNVWSGIGVTKEHAQGIALERARNELQINTVPDAPFKTTWPMLAMKRMVRYAAENGYDSVAWTPGEIQADRYDLSKKIDEIQWLQTKKGDYFINIYKDDRNISQALQLPAPMPHSDIEKYFGKDISEKILKSEKDHGSLSGLDLKVGGEGMKGFYDKILPAEVNKFFNKAAWGNAKVGQIDLLNSKYEKTVELVTDDGAKFILSKDDSTGVWHAYNRYDEAVASGKKKQELIDMLGGRVVTPGADSVVKVWALPITKEMRQKAMAEGMPLFENTLTYNKTSPILEQRKINDTLQAKQMSIFRDTDNFGQGVRTVSPAGRETPLAKAMGVKTVTQRIKDIISLPDGVVLKGQKIKSAADLAVLAQIFRDPRYETFRIFYTKGNKIVDHEGWTAKLPAQAPAVKTLDVRADNSSFERPIEDINKGFFQINNRMKIVGADGYYLVHNHPSGNSRPSAEDILATFEYYKMVSGMKGHLVIDSGEYTLIKPSAFKNIAKGQPLSRWMLNELIPNASKLPGTEGGFADPLLNEPKEIHNRKISRDAEVVQLANELKNKVGYATIFYGDAALRVGAVQEMPLSQLRDTPIDDVHGFFLEQARRFGTSQIIVHAFVDKNDSDLNTRLRKLIHDGSLVEAILQDPSTAGDWFSFMATGAFKSGERIFGKEVHETVLVREQQKEFNHIASKPLDKLPIDLKTEKSKDLSRRARAIQPPAWIAKKFPEMASLFERQDTRLKKRMKKMSETLKENEKLWKLRGEDLDSLRTLIWKLDGEQIKGLGDKLRKTDDGTYTINQEHYDNYRKWLDKLKISDRVKDIFIDIRKSLDRDLATVINTMQTMEDIDQTVIDEFRRQIGNIHNYFPHMRYGDHYIEIKDRQTGKVVYREHFTLGDRARLRVTAKLNELRKQYPEDQYILPDRLKKLRKLPEDVYSIPIPVDALEAVMNAAVNKMPDQESREAFRKLLPQAVAETLQSRGWGAHMIKRQGIPGHETDDIKRVLFDYKAGLYGWLTKMEASRDFADIMADVAPIASGKPQLWQAMRTYVKDMLENADSVDRAVNTIRGIFFAKYLGGNVKTAFLNMTQNIIAGWPRLGMETNFASGKIISGAASDIVNWVTRGRLMPEDEKRLLTEMFEEGKTHANFLNEVQGQISANAFGFLNKAMKALGWPMAVAERFNRGSIALAAFRVASDGKINNKDTLKRYGLKLGEKASYEKAKKFAEEIVDDAHFVYGKSNRPEIFRSGTVNKWASSAYTFRTFTHNLINLWSFMARSSRGRRAILKSIAGTAALGGMASIPLYKTFMNMIQQLTGDDPEKEVLDYLGMDESDLLRDMAVYGLPTIVGINLGGSLGMELPALERIKVNDSFQEMAGTATMEIAGIPLAMLEDISNAFETANSGQIARSFEYLTPTVISNILKGVRLYNEGSTTISGKAIAEPGGGSGPRRLSGSEAIKKALGFQPTSAAKEWDIYNDIQNFIIYRRRAQSEFANRFAAAYHKKDQDAMDKVISDLNEWNEIQLRDGHPEYIISGSQWLSAIRSRIRWTKTPKYMRGVEMEMMQE